MAESDWVDVPSGGASDSDWVDVPSGGDVGMQQHPLAAEANMFQKGASGFLSGVSNLGDMADLFMKYNPLSPMTFGQSKEMAGGSLGDMARTGFDTLTGVQDSTKIGADTLPYKMGEYLPSVLMGGESLVSNGLGGAAKTIVKTGLIDALSAMGGYEGNKIAGAPGEIVGSLLGASVPDIAHWALAGKGQGLLQSLVGYDSAAKQKVAGFVDSQGNLVEKAVEGGKQIGKKDLAVKNLNEAGFFDNVAFKDSPEDVANKLSIFKQDAGDALGNVVDEATKHEKDLLKTGTAQQKAAYLGQTNPDFSFAQDIVDSTTDSKLQTTLQRKLDDVAKRWQNSNQTLADLKKLQQDFGLTNKSSFATSAEKTINALNNRIYGSLAESVQGKIDLIGQAVGKDALGTAFSDANKAFSSAATFEDSAFNASKKFGVGQGIKDLWSFKTAGSMAAAHYLPVVGPLAAVKRLGTIAADIAPVQAAKALNFAETLSGGLSGNLAQKTASMQNLAPLIKNQEQALISQTSPSLEKGQKVDSSSLNSALIDLASQTKSDKPLNFIDKAMNKAEDKLAGKTPEAPVIVNAKRVDTTDPVQITKVMDGVFHQESGGKVDAVSSAGAKGVGQLMDATGKELFSKYKDILPAGSDKKYDPFDPVQNKALSTLYMKELLDQFDGDLQLALTAYNQGPGRVKNLLKLHDATTLDEIRPYLGKDGKAYARSIIARLKKQGVIEV